MKKLAKFVILSAVVALSSSLAMADPRAERKAMWDGGQREMSNRYEAQTYHQTRPTPSRPSNGYKHDHRRKRHNYNVNVNYNYNSGYYRPYYRPIYYDNSAYYSCKYNPSNCGYNKPYTIYGSAYYNNNGYSGGNIHFEYRGNSGGYTRYEVFIRD